MPDFRPDVHTWTADRRQRKAGLALFAPLGYLNAILLRDRLVSLDDVVGKAVDGPW